MPRCIDSEICGRDDFKRENQVEKHVLMEHTKRENDGTFRCIYNDCSVKSASYVNFRIHLRVHQGEYMVVCIQILMNSRSKYILSHRNISIQI